VALFTAGKPNARILGGIFVVVMGARIVGAALSPMLLAFAPLALLALSPVPACLVAVAALSAPLGYYAVAVTIPIVHGMIGYFLGCAQGPFITSFLVRRGVATEARLTRLLSPVRVSAPLIVCLIPGPIVCALAGASGTSLRYFAPALVFSQILWAFFCRLFGEGMLAWIATMRAELAHYALPLTLVTTAIVFVVYWRRRSRSASSSSASSSSEGAEPR